MNCDQEAIKTMERDGELRARLMISFLENIHDEEYIVVFIHQRENRKLTNL